MCELETHIENVCLREAERKKEKRKTNRQTDTYVFRSIRRKGYFIYTIPQTG